MFCNHRWLRTTVKWLAIFLLTMTAFTILAIENQFISIAYVLLGLAAALFFYPHIKSIKIFDLELILNKAKKKIEQKASQVDLRMLVRSIVLDSNEKDKIIPFITSPSNIRRSLGIRQTDAYSLDDLAKEGFISYELNPEKGCTNNSINQVKHYYDVTLLRAVVLS